MEWLRDSQEFRSIRGQKMASKVKLSLRENFRRRLEEPGPVGSGRPIL
jgi:hypothetical protein